MKIKKKLAVFFLFSFASSSMFVLAEPFDIGSSIEPMSPSECYPEEEFDAVEKVCYLPCEGLTEAQCIAYENRVYGDEDYDEYSSFSEGHKTQSEIESEPYTLYNVDSRLRITLSEKKATKADGYNVSKQDDIWFLITQIFPNDFLRKYVSEYAATYDDSLLGYVNKTDQKGKWVFGMNPNFYSRPIDPDFIHTLVHELGHIVFLNRSQIKEDYEHCNYYELAEGCSNKNAYINQFYQQFRRFSRHLSPFD